VPAPVPGLSPPLGSASSHAASASPGPAETVVRVDPDQADQVSLAHGRWEAPAWAFYVTAGVAVVGGVAWLAASLRTRRSGS